MCSNTLTSAGASLPGPHLAGLVGVVGLVVSIACGGSEAEVPRPRNLLFLAVDTLRADLLGAYGETPSATPTIDSLAASGVVFEHAISHASWTLPSFASVLTSQYTSTHGCWTFETPLAESFDTLPEIFQREGFDTFGVASHIFFNDNYGLKQGFDDFDDELAHSREEEGWVKVTSPLVTEKAVRWLDERAASGASDPWLLWLHYFDPHVPYVDHARESGGEVKPELARYRSEIAFTDGFLARVMEALERGGFADETSVVFLSDHGESFQEHPGVYRHARSLFREELRIPLVIRVPGVKPRRVSSPVRTVDLLPTLLDVFGIEPDRGMSLEGESLVSAMLGGTHVARPALAEIALHADAHHVRSIVDGGWKLIERRTGGFHLYDLAGDPAERTDLSGVHPERVIALRSTMEGLMVRARARGVPYAQGRKAVEHTPEEMERLKEMGYVGDE